MAHSKKLGRDPLKNVAVHAIRNKETDKQINKHADSTLYMCIFYWDI